MHFNCPAETSRAANRYFSTCRATCIYRALETTSLVSICSTEAHNLQGYVHLQNGDVLCFLWGTNWIYVCYVEESRLPLWSSGQSSWLQNGHVLCFLWGTNWIYLCYVEESRPPLWYSRQSSWLHNGDVLCSLWGTNWMYICYVEENRPPL
jgi:hypothetical protein